MVQVLETRQTPMRERERALDLVRTLCDAALAIGARRRVQAEQQRYGGLPTIYIDQIGGYHLVPVVLERSVGGTSTRINGWRVDRCVFCPAVDGDDDDGIAALDMVEPCHMSDTIEDAAVWVLLDVHRQWMAAALDEFHEDEYLQGRR